VSAPTAAPAQGPPAPGTAAAQVVTDLFRALAVLRVVVMGYAVVKNVGRMNDFAHPAAGWVVVVVIVGWTGLMTWAYDDPRRRTLPLYVADLAVAVVLVLSTPYIQSQHQLDTHAAHMPTFWVMAPVLAWAIGRGWVQGLLAAVLVSVCDLSVKVSLSAPTVGNIFLLLLGAGMVGYTSTMLAEAAELRAAADRTAAAATERQRIARVVHDGVLQVLALVQKRGAEIGGEAAELGRLAGEQEAALRAFVQHDSLVPAEVTGELDLADQLLRLQTANVSVAVPGTDLRVPAHDALEVVAVVAACLSNVRHHVGRDAPAWVLLEDRRDCFVVSVRDAGPGIPDGRLPAAAAEGRLGVAESVVRRVRDLGGSPALTTGPGIGTEWEFTFPRRAA
jgi:signal transduction histidine kinase